MPSDPHRPFTHDAVILGAGIGGLTLALRLAKAGRRVLVVEKSRDAGGVVSTIRDQGYLLECGPNSFSNGEEIMALIEEIGLGQRALLQPMKDHDRFVWRGGALRRVPMGPRELLGSDVLSLREKLAAAAGLLRSLPPPSGDVELGRFFRQRLGDGVVDALLKPFMAGVYASDADRISFETTVPALYTAATKNRRLISALRGMRAGRKSDTPRRPRCLVSFPHGLDELMRGLREAVTSAGASIHHGEASPLSYIEGRWQMTAGGDAVTTTCLVATGQAPETADLLAGIAPRAAALLRTIEYAPLGVVHLGIDEGKARESRRGFGFLTADERGIETLGMIWNDRIFAGRAPEGKRLLTCFFGGEKRADANAWPDERLASAAVADARKVLGLEGEPELVRVTRWKRALPIFRVGHQSRMAELREELPRGFHLLANFLGAVSMPDRVRKAGDLAREILRS